LYFQIIASAIMSRAIVSKHYARILSRWPVDRLRPEIAFQNVLKKRAEAGPTLQIQEGNTAQVTTETRTRDPTQELKEINALYSLLEDKYTRSYSVSQEVMHPASMPNHYTNLARELDELPDRTWFGNFFRRMKNMVRMQ